ncbi:phosphatase PAP2 family protein [Mycobacterium uberis]|uniref:Phosphatase PAP2 family protein n=1 Tax=Mycobacterium uberis TaxID=2162698 RepID=A0A3E1HKY6_9MYCO|nr:phosphatase PAP2 family protein [Mycobacterium uberis]RFD27161.1 phosphatase PAP2 family protein [Mycobacterium uberis]
MPEAPLFEAPTGELAVVVAVQSALVHRTGVLPMTRGMSHFGEHSIGWLVASLLGAILVPCRRRDWLVAGAGTFVAHGVAVLIKRMVQRTRPSHPAIAVNFDVPTQLSFPSAHVTSTTAAAILIGRASGLTKTIAAAVLVAPMVLSRIALGVHYPSDVAFDVVLSAAIAGTTARFESWLLRKWPTHSGPSTAGGAAK